MLKQQYNLNKNNMRTIITVVLCALIMPAAIAQKSKTKLATGWYFVSETATPHQLTIENGKVKYYLEKNAIINISHFQSVDVQTNPSTSKAELHITLTKEGEQKWVKTADAAIGRKVGFVVDGDLIYVTAANKADNNGVLHVSGNYKERTFDKLKKEIGKEKSK